MWNSSKASPGLREPRFGFFYFLPPLMYRVPQYVPTAANSQKNPQFNFELCLLFRTQLMHLHTCHLSILNIQPNTSSLLEKTCPNWHIQHILRKLLITVTHQLSLHTVEISVSKGIHYIELIRHSNTTTSTGTLPDEDQCPTLGANCCKGVVFGQ